MSLIQPFLAFAFGTSANQLGLHGILAGLGGCNLRFCLVDTRERLIDASILQFALAKILGNGGAGGLNCGFGLIHLRLIVIIL